MNNPNKNYDSLKLNPSHFLILWFGITILTGATLLNLPFASIDGNSIGFIDALFTSASAVCVTGLIVVNTAAHWTLFGKIVILILIQIGGLGIMTMATLIAFLLGRRITLKDRLLIREELNATTLQGIVLLTKRVLFMTIGIEAIGAVFLSFSFTKEMGMIKGIWYSIFHAVSAFCNAGFDITGNSLVDYTDDIIVNITVMLLIVLGGIGFYVFMEVLRERRFRYFSLHTKLVLITTTILIIFGAILVLVMEYNNPATLGVLNVKDKIMASFFQSVTPRTAGFNTIDTAGLKYSTSFLIIILMFIGGSPGSTAGGIKTTTTGIIIISTYRLVMGYEDIEFFKKRIDLKTVIRALSVVTIATFVVAVVTIILSITEINSGFTFHDVFFEVISAFGTVGLSRGLTPNLSNIGRIIITFTMFIGRIGPLTIAFAIAQGQDKNKGNYRFPIGKILVG